jgi:hypothetical protein
MKTNLFFFLNVLNFFLEIFWRKPGILILVFYSVNIQPDIMQNW